MNKFLLIFVIVLLLVAGGAFYGGTKYQESKAGTRQLSQNGARASFRGVGQNGQNAQAVRGEVLSLDNNSLTVKLSDGSSKLVVLSDNPSLMEATSASKAALSTGKQVVVFGTTNSDGSVTAQSIQLNPQTRTDQPAQNRGSN